MMHKLAKMYEQAWDQATELYRAGIAPNEEHLTILARTLGAL